jgi:hypothetical protein
MLCNQPLDLHLPVLASLQFDCNVLQRHESQGNASTNKLMMQVIAGASFDRRYGLSSIFNSLGSLIITCKSGPKGSLESFEKGQESVSRKVKLVLV